MQSRRTSEEWCHLLKLIPCDRFARFPNFVYMPYRLVSCFRSNVNMLLTGEGKPVETIFVCARFQAQYWFESH